MKLKSYTCFECTYFLPKYVHDSRIYGICSKDGLICNSSLRACSKGKKNSKRDNLFAYIAIYESLPEVT